uniref:NADH-ubiquinone oxidoreductase chain 6 n=1 Tax=Pharmacophagus antenor TaxID=95577 RepID=A0A336JGJ1_9NEOP|nr:NADH dehydrogenase subunit 6 [Pharmacophagus antenor]
MIKMFISMLIILFSISMFFLNHPLSMGFMILIQTLMSCILLGLMNYTYWFSYILFLIFIGGLLVLFIYVSSLASNELFNYNIFFKNIIFISIIFILMLTYMYMNNLKWMNFYHNSDMINFFNLFNFFNNENKINISKLYDNQIYFLMIMMIIYLFITLITVVKITNILFGPLRSFNF